MRPFVKYSTIQAILYILVLMRSQLNSQVTIEFLRNSDTDTLQREVCASLCEIQYHSGFSLHPSFKQESTKITSHYIVSLEILIRTPSIGRSVRPFVKYSIIQVILYTLVLTRSQLKSEVTILFP